MSSSNIMNINLDENFGYSYGNNLAAKYIYEHSLAEYLIIMNPDMFIPKKGDLDNLVGKIDRARKENSKIIGGQPVIHTMGQSKYLSIRRIPDKFDMLIQVFFPLRILWRDRYKKLWFEDLMPFNSDVTYYIPSGSFFVIDTKEFVDNIKMFDKRTFLYEEEVILGYKIRLQNKAMLLDHSIVMNHSQGESTGAKNNSMNWFMFKHMLHSKNIYARDFLKTSTFFLIILDTLFYLNFSSQRIIKLLFRIFNKK
ncbi:glycosyltransferase family protein [Lactiplantibacillus plantarum]|uniref:glycosyltransferase family 2 protein n=1 Tax=Lactiplantibacillus plantarum TaxID=1590 RepID=UPI00070CB0E5|nr:glycosyltransferase family 2 protein [Lactiplantibacillus plantarum]MCK8475396.1 glycosyltransferase family 2 protein [Lactiplantibacillus plantarum]RDD75132.1 glycosyltransferase family 2 protein [Lactiplantibacillus plantarum]